MEGVDVLGIGEGQLTGEVAVSGQQGGQGFTAVIGRKHDVHHSLGQRLNVSDQAGTAFIEDEDNGLAGSGQGLHQLLLVGRQVQVIHVAGGLTVGVLPYAGNDDIGLRGSRHGLGNAGSVFGLPVVSRQVLDTGLIVHVAGEAPLEGFQDGIELGDEIVGRSLPGVTPTAIERAEAVGIGTGDQDFLRSLKGQDTIFVLQQHLGLHGGVERLMGKARRSELGIITVPGGLLEQAQTDLQAQYATDGVIDAGHGNVAALGQVHNDVAALGVVRIHDHVDTGVDAHLHGFALVGGHMVAGIEVVNIGPVRHEQTVPAQFFLHPTAEQDGVGMGGNAVDRGTVHHGSKGAGAETLQERSEEFLTQVIGRNDGRSAVLSTDGHTVSHEMFEGNGHILQADVIGVVSLEGLRLLAGHHSLQVGIFSKALPDTRPAGVTPQVHHRGKHPRNLGGTGFISHGRSHHAGINRIKSGSKVNLLGIQGTFDQIRSAMDHVQAIDTRDADSLHGFLLNLTHHIGSMLPSMGTVVHDVQDRAYFILADDFIQLGGINGFVRLVLQDGDGKLDHLACFFLEGHAFQHLLNLGLNGLVGRNHHFSLPCGAR